MHTTVTLWDSLFEDGARPTDSVAGPPDDSETVRQLSRVLAARGCSDSLPEAAALITEKLKHLLSIGIAEDIFVKSWNDSGAFGRYLDRDVYPVDRTVDAPMIQSTVTCVHRPSIEIRRDGALLERIRVEVAFTLRLAYGVVEVRGGRIRRLRHGQCRGSAEVKVGGQVITTGTRDIALPPVIDFGKGIPIAPRVGFLQPLARSPRARRRRFSEATPSTPPTRATALRWGADSARDEPAPRSTCPRAARKRPA